MWGRRRRERSGLTCPILVGKIKASQASHLPGWWHVSQRRPHASSCSVVVVGVDWGGGGLEHGTQKLGPHSLKAQTYLNFNAGVSEW